MSTRTRWFVIGFVTTNLGFLAGNVLAGQLPEEVKKPVGTQIDPVEKMGYIRISQSSETTFVR